MWHRNSLIAVVILNTLVGCNMSFIVSCNLMQIICLVLMEDVHDSILVVNDGTRTKCAISQSIQVSMTIT